MTSRFVPSLEALFKATTSGLEARLKDANSGLSWSFNVPRNMATSFVALLSKAVPGVNWPSSEDLQVRLSDDDTPTVRASDSASQSYSYNSSPVDSDFFICRTAPGPWLIGQDSVELALERFRSERARGRQSAPRSSSALSSFSQYRTRSASPQRLVVRRHTDYGPRITRGELSRTIRTFEQHLLERGVRVERVGSEDSVDSSSDSDSEASSSYSDDNDDDMMTVTPAAAATSEDYDSISETEIDEESVHTVTANGLSAEVEDLTLDADADVDVDALPDLADDLDTGHNNPSAASAGLDTPGGIVTWTQQVPVATGSMLLDLEAHRDPTMVMVHEVLYDAKVSKSEDTASFVKSKLAALPGWTETLLDIDAAAY
ncbi:hypothetical protein EXIGLDRAFT_772599 [Exidia glandulosa HHB12029]|uniref:Uncharacterized protein n=1 Tax=Exidia glandulosa HHB12029 TaxID=1314781 RepID=A0A165F896_EXIGL|nr:hypothetical protein EXIGLDRAFT_772599 [Exidia glandulosa HHB12029]